MSTWLRALSLGLLLTACSPKESPPATTAEAASASEVASVEAPAVQEEEAPDTVQAVDEGLDDGGVDGPGDAATPGGVADGGACLAATDCQSGVCEGEGCGDDTPGVCVASNRACTRDLRPYCGCDGQTFRTSGSCPGRRYSSRTMCEGDQGPMMPPG